jgi:hypothetical protein
MGISERKREIRKIGENLEKIEAYKNAVSSILNIELGR